MAVVLAGPYASLHLTCSFCAIAAAVPPRPQDGTVSVIVLFTIVFSCVTDFDCNTVRCPVTDLFVKCHLKLHIVIDIDSRQATTPAPHHSVFYRPDAFSAAQPTASKHWLFISAAVLSAQQILLFLFSSSCYLLLLMCSMPMQRTQSVYCQHIAVCRMWSHDHRYAILHYTRLTASFPGQPG